VRQWRHMQASWMCDGLGRLQQLREQDELAVAALSPHTKQRNFLANGGQEESIEQRLAEEWRQSQDRHQRCSSTVDVGYLGTLHNMFGWLLCRVLVQHVRMRCCFAFTDPLISVATQLPASLPSAQ
jgi:hypothetical protein